MDNANQINITERLDEIDFVEGVLNRSAHMSEFYRNQINKSDTAYNPGYAREESSSGMVRGKQNALPCVN